MSIKLAAENQNGKNERKNGKNNEQQQKNTHIWLRENGFRILIIYNGK